MATASLFVRKSCTAPAHVMADATRHPMAATRSHRMGLTDSGSTGIRDPRASPRRCGRLTTPRPSFQTSKRRLPTVTSYTDHPFHDSTTGATRRSPTQTSPTVASMTQPSAIGGPSRTSPAAAAPIDQVRTAALISSRRRHHRTASAVGTLVPTSRTMASQPGDHPAPPTKTNTKMALLCAAMIGHGAVPVFAMPLMAASRGTTSHRPMR